MADEFVDKRSEIRKKDVVIETGKKSIYPTQTTIGENGNLIYQKIIR